MQPLVDEDADEPEDTAAEDMDTNPLTQYDSERKRVESSVADYIASDERHDEAEAAEHAVPTEFLQEDLQTTIELPIDYRVGRLARVLANRPGKVLCVEYAVALVLLIWVLLTPGERFSVSDSLFEASDDDDVVRAATRDRRAATAARARQLARAPAPSLSPPARARPRRAEPSPRRARARREASTCFATSCTRLSTS